MQRACSLVDTHPTPGRNPYWNECRVTNTGIGPGALPSPPLSIPTNCTPSKTEHFHSFGPNTIPAFPLTRNLTQQNPNSPHARIRPNPLRREGKRCRSLMMRISGTASYVRTPHSEGRTSHERRLTYLSRNHEAFGSSTFSTRGSLYHSRVVLVRGCSLV